MWVDAMDCALLVGDDASEWARMMKRPTDVVGESFEGLEERTPSTSEAGERPRDVAASYARPVRVRTGTSALRPKTHLGFSPDIDRRRTQRYRSSRGPIPGMLRKEVRLSDVGAESAVEGDHSGREELSELLRALESVLRMSKAYK